MTDEQNAQMLSEADELEFTYGSQYPPGSRGRMMYHYFAEVIRRECALSDEKKIELTRKALELSGPCTKEDLIERLDFTRSEGRRIVDLAVQTGMIETIKEHTNGRSRVIYQIP